MNKLRAGSEALNVIRKWYGCGGEMTQYSGGDPSNGYEAVAREFIAHRTQSTVGVTTVRKWAEALPLGATVLELGPGHGVPISQTLIDAGFRIYAVEASPSLAAAFRVRFPSDGQRSSRPSVYSGCCRGPA